MELKVIAKIHNGFHEKFGIPRQSGLVPELTSVIVFEEEFRNDDALKGIDGYSHLWLLWGFSQVEKTDWRPTVRPPRLGGNTRMGVFATRSPYRPNNIGLSSVVLSGIEKSPQYGTLLKVKGADLMDGTPIYDIKPYIAYTDAHPDAVSGFADNFVGYRLKVCFPEHLLSRAEPEDQRTLFQILEQDPRPAYQDDEARIYKMDFGPYQLSFSVSGDTLTVTDLQKS
ncbi:MAG: tRNA (N6-threonylcarbamoyladenosine(37)-N6)-methyltransferase TrmO [Clostridia bacterium]|nr:tRNA (N6-threonylcarbamoyladenosine(37)-N6)-methyltransferase TrmO [Clostridia bacterium]